MASYKNNHYVPAWYQQQFIPEKYKDKKFEKGARSLLITQ
jgi:hypothetical protein